MKKNSLQTYSVLISIFFLFIIYTLISNNLINENKSLVINQVYVLLLFIINIFFILWTNKIKKKNFSLILALNLTFMVFLLSVIFLDIFKLAEFGKNTFFTKEYFSIQLKISIIYSLELALIGLNLGDLISNNISLIKNNFQKKYNDFSNFFEKIGTLIFSMGYIATLYKTIYTIKFRFDHGYLSLYTNEEILNFNGLINIFDGLTYIGLALVLAFSKKTNKIYFIISIYSVNLLLYLLTGRRAESFLQLLILLVYLAVKLGKKLKIRYIIIFLILSILVGQTISYERNYINVDNKTMINKVIDFFNEQGGSSNVIGYTMKLKEKFDSNYRSTCVFRPLINAIKYKVFNINIKFGNNYETANEFGTFGAKLSYIVNKDLYYKGSGLGGCYIAELWLTFGMLGVFIGNIILAIFVNFLDSNSKTNKFIMYIMLIIGPKLLLAPRGGYFDFIWILINAIKIYLIIFILYMIKYFIFNRRRQK